MPDLRKIKVPVLGGELIDELAADFTLYQTRLSHYNKIIAFVWDNSGSIQYHDELRRGIVELGIVDAVFVSRPGDWKT